MKTFKVDIVTSYELEAEDEEAALDKAEELLAEDMIGICCFEDIFGFYAEEIK